MNNPDKEFIEKLYPYFKYHYVFFDSLYFVRDETVVVMIFDDKVLKDKLVNVLWFDLTKTKLAYSLYFEEIYNKYEDLRLLFINNIGEPFVKKCLGEHSILNVEIRLVDHINEKSIPDNENVTILISTEKCFFTYLAKENIATLFLENE